MDYHRATLPHLLFAVFISDLVQQLKDNNIGIHVGDVQLPISMYTDDVILGNNHDEAQHGLDIMSDWCRTWQMKVNIRKIHTIHHPNHQRPHCKEPLVLSGAEMEYVSNYIYLGC